MSKMKRNADFIFKRFVVGPMEVNCYCVGDLATGEACLIDPGAEPHALKEFIAARALDLKFIVNTHGHGDHIAANSFFNVPIYIHALDKDFLTDPEKNLSSFFLFSIKSPPASRILKDHDRISLGNFEFEVIHTPGHTPGSITLALDGLLFTGDALFAGGIGRTDFEYGDSRLLLKSIKERLLVFEDDTVIYPGHGESSTIAEEKRSNPFLV